MFKHLVLLCVVICVIEAMPKWQFLPPRDGYVPVYIRPGDTPLEEINPDLAEAFHALPAGRSAGKQLDASPDTPEPTEQPRQEPETPDQPRQEPETPDQPRQEPETPDQPRQEPKTSEPTDYHTTEQETKGNEIPKPEERR